MENGTRLGPYEILDRLGAGGMGEVYRARDVRLDRDVAVKVLPSEVATDREWLARLRREAQLLGRLSHQNVAQLHGLETQDGVWLLIMELVAGETLDDRIKRQGRLALAESAVIAEQICKGLEAAHSQHIVHRDLKPSNVVVREDASGGLAVKILDFGLAKSLSSGEAETAVSASPTALMATRDGLIQGTAPYMSPEQARGKVADQRTDIWAFGCVLFEMLTGKRAFGGATVADVIAAILQEAPDLSTLPVEVPHGVRALLARCLAKDPAERLRDAGDTALLLREALESRAADRNVGGGVGARTVGWLVAAALGVALAAILLAADPAPRTRRLALAVPEGAVPSTNFAISPDGSFLVVAGTSTDSASRSLYIVRLDDRARIPIPGTERARGVAVSPDGQQVVFSSPTGVYAIPVAGGRARALDDGEEPCCVRWSEDGYIYFSRQATIYRVPAAGGETEEVVRPRTEGEALNYYEPLATGDHALIGVGLSGPDRIDWFDARSGERRVAFEGASRPFATTGGYVLYSEEGGAIHAARLKPDDGTALGDPVVLVDSAFRSSWGVEQDAGFAVSRSGDLAYWAAEMEGVVGSRLMWVGRDGDPTEAWIDPTGQIESVEISPDGQLAAMGIVRSEQGTEVWIKPLNGSSARPVTSYRGMNRRPIWSPDGQSLAFISDRGGPRAVYTVPVTRIVEPTLVLEQAGKDIDEVLWSPDGSWLVYRTGTVPGARDIYAHRPGSDPQTIVVAAQDGIDEMDPALSPDGRWLAYVSNQSGRTEVWVRPFPEASAGSRRVSLIEASEPVWSRSGDELFFRTDAGLMSVEVLDPVNFIVGDTRVLVPSIERYFSQDVHHSYAHDERSDRFLMIQVLPRRLVTADLVLIQNFRSILEESVAR